ncbi:hypothetical protein ACH4GE_41240 [Streptomyces tendae]|uniref:hypothetical protein n=1 Tax=Streptomyces tendae TaxID=1932 RepID=UPI0037A24F49
MAGQEIGLLGALFTGVRSDARLAEEMRRILRRDEAAMTDEPLRKAIRHGEQLAPPGCRTVRRGRPGRHRPPHRDRG